MLDKDIIYKNLAVTQAYCALQLRQYSDVSVAELFRSINPVVSGEKMFRFHMPARSGGEYFVSEWTQEPDSILLDYLFRYQIARKKAFAGKSGGIIFSGALLATQIDVTVKDGGSEVESKGLIDSYDFAPIDTWLCIADGYLLAWIPERMITLAQNAIDVNIVNYIHWYDVETGRFYDKPPF